MHEGNRIDRPPRHVVIRDEGDLLNPPKPAPWWKLILGLIVAVVVVYLVLTAALVLTHS